MECKLSTSFRLGRKKYELELNCVNDLCSFYVYNENGGIVTSYHNVPNKVLKDLVKFL